MGRGRAPCCAKVGLNKGSWTPEEDMRLIAYIHKYGHGNWRALPKLAGLLRCGKSCRLRWINYLRPDIKRGNFTKEEEDTIIKLHELLGNKWSKIASCLPGRTDNEIKNVWNTHLKKRVAPKDQRTKSAKKNREEQPSSSSSITTASVSCSDEGDSKTEKEQTETKDEEIDKIEIPIEPNLDLWDMLQNSSPLQEQQTLESDQMSIDFPEIPNIDPDIWNLIDDDVNIAATTGTTTATDPVTNLEAESRGGDESERWLQYLEKELDLWGESPTGAFTNAGIEEGDPVASYFQALQSSPSPLDLLY